LLFEQNSFLTLWARNAIPRYRLLISERSGIVS
jgi:hypothetical protein